MRYLEGGREGGRREGGNTYGKLIWFWILVP